ncbi:kinase-like protein, partial [Dendrothele bispora CBS 962.96]
AFCHEALLWRQLNHPNVLPFLGVNINLFTPARLCLILPWMENRNIIQYLTNHPGHDLLCTISEIAAGLNYLHNLSRPIVHGDIRGANILVNLDSRCCLADFGLSLATETTQGFTTTSDGVKGCARWLAPELSPQENSRILI